MWWCIYVLIVQPFLASVMPLKACSSQRENIKDLKLYVKMAERIYKILSFCDVSQLN